MKNVAFVFCKNEKDNLKTLGKNMLHQSVLSRWVIKEAAIKWQRGSLYKDLVKWESSIDYKWALHTSKNLKVSIHLINYKSWLIGIAYDNEIHLNSPFICVN